MPKPASRSSGVVIRVASHNRIEVIKTGSSGFNSKHFVEVRPVTGGTRSQMSAPVEKILFEKSPIKSRSNPGILKSVGDELQAQVLGVKPNSSPSHESSN